MQIIISPYLTEYSLGKFSNIMYHCEKTSDSHNEQIQEKLSVNLSWTRPNNIPYPNIWLSLWVKSKNGQTYRVKIEDVTPDRYEEVLDFMFTNYDCREPLSRSIEITMDSESINARREFQRKVLQQKVSIIAVLQNDQNNDKNPIMGALLLSVISKNDPPLEITGEKCALIMNFFKYLKKDIDPFQLLNSDIYLDDFGLAVAPEYYGLGLGFHLMSCILKMMKAFNIPGSVNTFSSTFSQPIAIKLGYKLCKEVSYEEYKDKEAKQIFPIKGIAKCMILKMDD